MLKQTNPCRRYKYIKLKGTQNEGTTRRKSRGMKDQRADADKIHRKNVYRSRSYRENERRQWKEEKEKMIKAKNKKRKI